MASFWQHLRVRDLAFYKREWFARDSVPRGRVLDLPAGSGRDARSLHELGYAVTPADLFPEWFEEKLRGADCVHADMAKRLPFEAGSFDYLLCSEGIEHLADQMAFLGECRRVLVPGGRLLLTTPNLLSLRGRVAFMLTGNRAFKSFVDEVTSVWGHDGERLYHGHAFLINYFQLRYMLHHSGFRVREVVAMRYSPSSLLLTPLVPFVGWFTRQAMRRARRKNPSPGIYREIRRHVLSPAMLYSGNLFLVAERLADAEREAARVVPHHARRLEARMRAARESRAAGGAARE